MPIRNRPLTAKQKIRVAAAGNAVRIDDVSGYAWSRIRLRIRERDQYTCQSCNIGVQAGIVDHKIALINGGNNADDNLQLLCEVCHTDKTNRDLGYKVKTRTNESGLPTNPDHHWNK
ncbi:HNH endonuclease [Burkholderia sp. S171]|uniref:HNH endonuclease n=1 Tax=Burkholderia sp. S171 TaxID=1641860 RepID=UPI0020B1576B|nr:HNH endonuclease [Burkholderia sp. S171]